MNERQVKIVKYEPLTFACTKCDQQFNASGEPLAQIAAEIADHISRNHPKDQSQAPRQSAGPLTR